KPKKVSATAASVAEVLGLERNK
ncbi:MAG: hypothetical protein RJB32_398, partial [Actinomycetota bacterium]